MNAKLQLEELKQQEGCEIVDSFSTEKIRTFISTLEAGDTFTIPKDFKGIVCRMPMPDGSNKAEFINVDVTSTHGDTESKRIYPSYFSKSLPVVDEFTGKSLHRMLRSSGDPCDKYRAAGTVNAGMLALKGRKIKVAAVNHGFVHVFNGAPTDTRSTSVYEFEFVK